MHMQLCRLFVEYEDTSFKKNQQIVAVYIALYILRLGVTEILRENRWNENVNILLPLPPETVNPSQSVDGWRATIKQE